MAAAALARCVASIPPKNTDASRSERSLFWGGSKPWGFGGGSKEEGRAAAATLLLFSRLPATPSECRCEQLRCFASDARLLAWLRLYVCKECSYGFLLADEPCHAPARASSKTPCSFTARHLRTVTGHLPSVRRSRTARRTAPLLSLTSLFRWVI